MKVLIISDIHANYEALRMLQPYIERSDNVLCLGDIVGYSCAVNECIDFIRSNKFICIQGNHDRYIIEGMDTQTKFLNESVRFGINHALITITDDNYIWLKSLPVSLGLKIENISIMMSHGSPFDPINGYVYENNNDFTTWEDFKYDYILIGHTHRTMIKEIGNKLIINPGSVGQARDCEGKVCACILDTQYKSVEHIYLDYDYKKNLELSLSFGAKEWIYKHFQSVI